MKLLLVFTLLILINLFNYAKISEMLFENSLVSTDFVIFDILNMGSLIGIIVMYFLIVYSAIIIYIFNYTDVEEINTILSLF